jgi:hypothetical protein|uniref:PEGA domain-containing protein n=1 Tax=Cephaloticoccus sp. TaxID=1985742 RepID=UPI00404A6477
MTDKLKSLFAMLLLGVGLAPLQLTASSDQATAEDAYTVAIFVANRADKSGDNDLGALEDYITGSVTNLNVQVISGETALDAVSSMAPGAKATALDQQFAEGTSAVRLAQTLGANYLLQVTLTGFDSNRRKIDAYGVKSTNDERTVRVTYKILDGVTGASLAADTVRVSKVYQQTDTTSDEHSSVINGLLDEAAQKVAASLKRQIDLGRIKGPTALASDVAITLTTELADLYIPDVRIDADNTVSISQSKFKVSALTVTVEVDGIAVGTAPGVINTAPGLHKLRVVREGFKLWERTVNFRAGHKMNVALEMTDEAYARWKDATAFINGLKNGAKLTDAEVKKLEGEAKMLENSGFKVNVDTDEGITFTNHSLFGN